MSIISTVLLALVVKQSKHTIMDDRLWEQMYHKNTTVAFAAIVAAVALTAVAFAVPQLALAGGYHHHNHNSNSNSIKVVQQINQLNACTNSSFCQNNGSNDAQIHR